MEKNEMKEYLYKLGGLAEEIYQDQEIFEFFLPSIRMDFKIVDDYTFNGEKRQFNTHLIVLSGDKDGLVDHESMDDWQAYTNKTYQSHIFNGNHFFITHITDKLVDVINGLYQKYN